MNDIVNIKIFEDKELVKSLDVSLPVILGRQDSVEAGLYTLQRNQVPPKITIANLNETTVGRSHLLLEPLLNGLVAITNINPNRAVQILDKATLAPKSTFHSELPTSITFEKQGKRRIILSASGSELMSTISKTLPPQSNQTINSSFNVNLSSFRKITHDTVDRGDILSWLGTLMEVLQSAADSDLFFIQAVQAAVGMVELDQAVLYLFDGSSWTVRASHTAPDTSTDIIPPSQRILNIIVEEKRVFWQAVHFDSQISKSLKDVESVIVAPILSSQDQVIGVVYGTRLNRNNILTQTKIDGPRNSLGDIEGRLIELLAKGVAAGIARLDQEKQAVQAKVRFEQFFTPQLATQLAKIPDWDIGRQAEITALFVDIKDFTRLSERLDPSVTIKWIQDTLNVLSEFILNRGGALVDYIGDAILAIWGAPEIQTDHAERACLTAIEMVSCLSELGPRWEGVLGERMDLSIGINSGMAQVGNIGSQHKFKYGALGSTVNLCSRIQGLNKRVGTRILIADSTEKLLPANLLTRRLSSVLPNNFENPVTLHELFPPGQSPWPRPKADYEKALYLFEKGDFGLSTRMLGNYRAEFPNDVPSLHLLYRSVKGMVEGKDERHPVWVFREK
ncbi:MAG: adenylate/guanylate cyclase domain-containing protein [Gemmataceae bacterium]|nr:adenylate/guanylate cyclase domain-containing protein [Gemmataceae bacterium]